MGEGTIETPGTLVASGLLGREADRVRDAFGPAGLSAERIVEDGEWAALLLRR
jgi:ribosomal protein L11 methylase PrmA